MRVRVDYGADAVHLNLTDRPIKDSEEVADGIVVDYDAEGRIVGIEILRGSTTAGLRSRLDAAPCLTRRASSRSH
jgi:uncharacterized protein YuzE